PYWDPLQFAIEEAHARGLELHAWFNPFRAGFVAKRTPLAEAHVSKRRPDLVRRYGTHYWLDPGEPDARRLAIDVVTDVVRRYDVDAVHLDDYFYPYQERDARGRLIPFPDDATWREHGVTTGLSRADWRRSNTDAFVEQLYHAVHAEKRHVAVGISPFGIWRPGYPASVRGLDTYSELYADTRKWLANGWADYFAPQLYWRTHAPQQDYATLLQWWAEQNEHGRHIWAGNIPNRVGGGTSGWPASEIVEQVRLTRATAGASGNVHFSAGSLLRNTQGITTALRDEVYLRPALVPAMPWLSDGPGPAPAATAAPDPALLATLVSFEPRGDTAARWIVRARWGDHWDTLLLPGTSRHTYVGWRDGAPPDMVAVAAIGPAGVETDVTTLEMAF
ncbi:MAG: family 10 glycosylhydrolase, partial [Gemmatimonadota bacterium]